ncbi:MAG: type II secretion system F family protein [Alphaproteobacteria bacterium]
MSRFHYRVMTQDGDIVEDVMEAASRDEVVAHIRESGRLPIDIATLDQDAMPGAVTSPAAVRAGTRRRGGRPDTKALSLFTRKLGTLLDAGLTLPRALSILAGTGTADASAALARDLHHRIREGVALSDAMDAHPDRFDPFYRAMIRAGEGAGALGGTLGRLADFLDKAATLRAAIRSALIYPTILLAAVVVSIVLLITLVLPQFEALLRGAPGELPGATRAVFAVADFLRVWGGAVLGALLLPYILARAPVGGAGLRRWGDGMALRLPLIGEMIRMTEFERIFRSLATLTGNGVGLPRALELVAAIAQNHLIADAIATAYPAVRRGELLSDALVSHKAVPPLAVQLIQVGEESGALDAMLLRIADIFAAEVELTLKRLVSLIEPALIILIGGLVATIVVSLLSAIMGINALAL